MEPTPYYVDDRHWAIISVRILSIITSLPAFPALAWTIPAHNDVHTDSGGHSIVGGVVAGTAYAFLWSTIVLISRLAFHRPIHPGIYIAFDFIAFGLITSFTVLLMTFTEPYVDRSYTCRTGISCSGDTLRRVEWFGAIMALICCATHLGLFVWACWATDIVRKMKKREEVSG
ncbi:hypothetical protein BDW62DRAFT_220180 [Aspergillus aurantiobrunneus]